MTGGSARRLLAVVLVSGLAWAAAADEGGVAADAPYSRKGADTCFRCHDDAVSLGVFHTAHAVPTDARGPFGPGQLQCEACHGPGGDHARRVRRGEERPAVVGFGSDASTPVATQNAMCLACHADDTGAGWHVGAHDAGQVACADCHTSHKPQDAVLRTATQPEVCFDCHREQRLASLKPFAHPVRDGKMACDACHAPHGDAAGGQLTRASVNETCHDCHAETRGPFLWEHAPVAEDCGACHDPHGSIHPGMLSQRGPLLCQACHSQAGHPSVSFDASGLADSTPSKFLLGQNCMNCHTQVHGSNHPSGSRLMR